jgi:chromosomal replication initiator protein
MNTPPPSLFPVMHVVEPVREVFDVSYVQLVGRARPNAIAIPRMVAMALAYELLHLNVTQVGRAFDRDHTSVSHARRAVADMRDTDSEFARKLEVARQMAVNRLSSCGPIDYSI